MEQKDRDCFGERPGPARFIALMPRLFAPFFGLLHSLSGLHVVMDHAGVLMAIRITPGNADDRAALVEMVAGLEGKLLADKGHIPKKRFAGLRGQGDI